MDFGKRHENGNEELGLRTSCIVIVIVRIGIRLVSGGLRISFNVQLPLFGVLLLVVIHSEACDLTYLTCQFKQGQLSVESRLDQG